MLLFFLVESFLLLSICTQTSVTSASMIWKPSSLSSQGWEESRTQCPPAMPCPLGRAAPPPPAAERMGEDGMSWKHRSTRHHINLWAWLLQYFSSCKLILLPHATTSVTGEHLPLLFPPQRGKPKPLRPWAGLGMPLLFPTPCLIALAMEVGNTLCWRNYTQIPGTQVGRRWHWVHWDVETWFGVLGGGFLFVLWPQKIFIKKASPLPQFLCSPAMGMKPGGMELQPSHLLIQLHLSCCISSCILPLAGRGSQHMPWTCHRCSLELICI